ncbi:FAD-binding oxidoreductase [Marinactinospora thermotolerans]
MAGPGASASRRGGDPRAVLEEVRDAIPLRSGAGDDAVGGVVPALVAAPPDAAAVAKLLAVSARHGLTVVARGNGTKLDWGRPPRRCDLLVDTGALNRIEHASGDLVVRAEAGAGLAELDAVLARAGQRLVVDPVVPGSSLGGVVATGLSGPRRALYGPLRDLIIGMTVVRADGVTVRSGGAVVKNVAGYDLGKLHTGAFGTLGLITSVTLRLHPVPSAARHVWARTTDPATARGWILALLDSQTVPSAVEVDWPVEGPIWVQVLLEGAEDGIAARARDVADLLEGAEAAEEAPPGWGVLPGRAGDTLLKLTCAPPDLVAAVQTLRTATERAGVPVAVRGSAGAGVVHAAVPADADPVAVHGAVSAARAALPRGWLTVPRAGADLLAAGLDPWGEVPGLPLMRAVKDRFDPRNLLSPGRFVDGI